ncbi:prolactin-releasing peptide receptor-like [Limulus polyphemus]|uniref:Prolactin-releasing peptide receptor-like n=1 Tax=Limulus polyphemus TaxID=6850 RepID=A0ABM1S6U6_LIMPO|nr:prolactin-releasing peptide receptor-like [Limulus polyphemus]
MSYSNLKGIILDSFALFAEFQNVTLYRNNSFFENYTQSFQTPTTHDYITTIPGVRVFFYCLYIIIFITGICGNVLVCYVVFRNKSMQTVTNIFITNLALSDILLCTFAVTFTPLYIFLRQWIFGRVFCHLLPYVQGVSVYISAITLMSIAIDRFFVIIYPFKSRLKVKYCLMIVVIIWITAALLTLPYGIFISLTVLKGRLYCDEEWPHEASRRAFGLCTSVLQFVVPFIIISICYLKVCSKLRDRARTKPGTKSLRKEEWERERTRKTNRMLIAMVVIFGVSWLPLNMYNLVVDFHIPALSWEYLSLFFVLSHSVAMGSTCYNPFLYAWLNDNFRKEFKMVLPCFKVQPTTRMINSAKHDRTCNGHDTVQETLMLRANSLKREVRQEKTTSVKYMTETDTVKLQIVSNEDEVI